MKKQNQKIGCEVESCKHLNCDEHICSLNEIKVANKNGQADCKEETICDSYDKKEQ